MYPITKVTSDGSKLPREARPNVRINVTIMTTVTNTIKVAPKLRDNSLRRVEWNNIAFNENMRL